ncbi:MAG: carcinine hydrolase/isopenicillin-N N-acyltransferase family protein [Candidatus Hodarchaeales archaeon]|jgi:hypothetical protein
MKTKNIIPLSFLLALLFINVNSSLACTVFTASQGDTVLAGNNEDWYPVDTQVRFISAKNGYHGMAIFGFTDIWFQGGMNDEGLFVDITSLPPVEVVSHPEKVEIQANVAEVALLGCSTVNEVIQLYNTTRFFNTWSGQYLFVDASGDAVVISVDSDGELAYTRKEENYLLMTNFNLANPDNGRYPCERYDTGLLMLDDMDNVTVDGFQSVLSAVHQRSTLYSNIYDLVNREVYIYYFHQFQEVVKISLSEELTKGDHVVPLIDLFSSETKAAALVAYQTYQLSFMLAETISIIALVVNIVCIAVFSRKIVKRRGTSVKKDENNVSLIILGSFAWTLTFWSYPLLISNRVYNFIYLFYNIFLPLPINYILLLGWLGPLVVGGIILKKLLNHIRS